MTSQKIESIAASRHTISDDGAICKPSWARNDLTIRPTRPQPG